jgi:hypothetical protein
MSTSGGLQLQWDWLGGQGQSVWMSQPYRIGGALRRLGSGHDPQVGLRERVFEIEHDGHLRYLDKVGQIRGRWQWGGGPGFYSVPLEKNWRWFLPCLDNRNPQGRIKVFLLERRFVYDLELVLPQSATLQQLPSVEHVVIVSVAPTQKFTAFAQGATATIGLAITLSAPALGISAAAVTGVWSLGRRLLQIAHRGTPALLDEKPEIELPSGDIPGLAEVAPVLNDIADTIVLTAELERARSEQSGALASGRRPPNLAGKVEQLQSAARQAEGRARQAAKSLRSDGLLIREARGALEQLTAQKPESAALRDTLGRIEDRDFAEDLREAIRDERARTTLQELPNQVDDLANAYTEFAEQLPLEFPGSGIPSR